MFYEIPVSALSKRFFSSSKLYSDVDFGSLDAVVDAYCHRILEWYLNPAKELAKNFHFAFAVMALDCLLIDALSQFVAGIEASSGEEFKRFIRMRLPGSYSAPLQVSIRHSDGKGERTLTDVADVIYYAFRCGVVHQAHVTLYGGVAPGEDQAVVPSSGLLKYKDTGTDCPSVVLNPLVLLKDLEYSFEQYLADLKNREPSRDGLRANFKKKFSSSFGIDIASAS